MTPQTLTARKARLRCRTAVCGRCKDSVLIRGGVVTVEAGDPRGAADEKTGQP